MLEDGLVDGGIGTELDMALRKGGSLVPVELLGIQREFIAHASRASVLAKEGMSVEDVIAAVHRIGETAASHVEG